MTRITRLVSDDLQQFFKVIENAYPGWDLRSADERESTLTRFRAIQDEDTTTGLYGAWRDEQITGGMYLRDFAMNLYGSTVKGAGVGMVAVGLPYKKQKIAKDLITFFVRRARAEGMPVAMLYPFRPDFYRAMGFGWGTKVNHYRVDPAAFPRGSREHVRMLEASDAAAVQACYQRFYERTHGMFAREAKAFEEMLGQGKQRVAGVERDGAIVAYLVWTFESGHSDNSMLNNMAVSELVYDDGAALGELCAFLHTQADQIDRVVLQTQDAYLHHLLGDPRNATRNFIAMSHETNTQGIGMMYRVVDVPLFFRTIHHHAFGTRSLTVRFTIVDTFLAEGDGSTTVRFADGRPEVAVDDTADVEIRLEIAHFSSLAMGVVPFKALVRHGLAQVSDPAHIPTLQQMFAGDEPPVCMTYF